MTDSIDDALRNLLYPNKTEISGTIGLSSSVITLDNRPGYVWVRLLSNPNEAV
jgi:hypothetical protein